MKSRSPHTDPRRTRPGRSVLGTACVAGAALCGATLPLAAQTEAPADTAAGSVADPVLAEIDRLYFDGNPAESLRRADGHLVEEGESYPLLWRAARAAAATAILGRDERELWKERLEEAMELAERALDLRPGGTEATHQWIHAAGERVDNHAGLRHTATLAEGIHARAAALLARDSADAVGHHALGMLYYRLADLPSWKRVMAGLFVEGELIDEADWDSARDHLVRAVELDPDNLRFRIGVGRLETARENAAVAKELFREVIRLPRREPYDEALATEAQVRLDDVLSWAPDPPG